MTFFYALLFIVLSGAFQGLVVLPVLLDSFRPQAHAEVEIEHEHTNQISHMGEGAAVQLSDPNKVDAVDAVV